MNINHTVLDALLPSSTISQTHPYSHIATALRTLGEFCISSQAPLNGAILIKTADAITSSDKRLSQSLQRVFQQWRDESLGKFNDQAVGLRWVGVWHYFALTHTNEALSAAYPNDANNWTSDANSVWSLIVSMIDVHFDGIVKFMQYEPQTNEINRSILLLPGFLTLARQFPSLPLNCLEIGASAGLNTLWPHFHYKLTADGTVTWGDEQSIVEVSTMEWKGRPITSSLAQALTPALVETVRGCDHSPFDLNDESQVLRLRSYVWPSQRDRIERQLAALTLAKRHGVTVERGDAADWTMENVRLLPDRITVLYHSFVWQYLPEESRTRILSHMRKVGIEATATSPLAWLTVEQRNDNSYSEGCEVKLTVWPGGEERVLADCHPHSRWIDMK